MNIIVERFQQFTADILKKLADVGTKTVLIFDNWHDTEPQRGIYNFDNLIKYAHNCKNAGIDLLVQTPLGTPLWASEDWYLKNRIGQNNSFSHLIHGHTPNTVPALPIYIILANRFFSYWNEESQDYTENYIKTIRKVLEPEGATCISSLGAAGEYFFPAVGCHSFMEIAANPWWYDKSALNSMGFREAPEWFMSQRKQIIAKRLALYREKWTQFVPYYASSFDANWEQGNKDIMSEMASYTDLKTILWTVFYMDFPILAKEQAAIFPTWGGAEGCDNMVENTAKALKMGLQGTICGPIHEEYGTTIMEDWKYAVIKQANEYTI